MTIARHSDGCVKGNIPIRPYRVILVRHCEHAKLIAASTIVNAINEHYAREYIETWIKLPRTHVHSVEEVNTNTMPTISALESGVI